MKLHLLAPVLLLFAAVFAASPAWAEVPTNAPEPIFQVTGADVDRAASRCRFFDCCELPCWDFEVAIPVWIPGITGTTAAGDVEADIEDGLGDVLDKLLEVSSDLRFAFVGAAGVQHGRWSVMVDAFGAKLGAGVTLKRTNGTIIEGETAAIIARARVGYEFVRRPFSLFGREACLTTSAYAGMRYHYATVDFDLPFGIQQDTHDSWVDPLVGLDAELLWGRWGMRLCTDVGGFGVGSELAFWFSGELEYRFSRLFSIAAGYALLDVDFEDGEGADRFVWNVRLQGPILGLRFRF